MKKVFLLTLLFYAMTLPSLLKAEVYLKINSQNYSDSFSVHDLYKDKPTTMTQGSRIFSHSQIDTGFAVYSFLSIGYTARYDGIILHSPDTAEIYFSNKNKPHTLENRKYIYRLKADIATSQNISFTTQHEINKLKLKWNLQLGRAKKLTHGTANGDLNLNTRQITGNANIDYYYEKDSLLDREVTPSTGIVTALSLTLEKASKIGFHSFEVKDLYHRIEWRTAPHTQLEVNSNRIAGQNSRGKLIVRPLGQGTEDFKTLNQSLPARYFLKNHLHTKYGSVLLNTDYIAKKLWPALGFQWHLGQQELSIQYSIRDQAVSLRHKPNTHIEYSLALDSFDIKKANRVNLGFSLLF